MRFQSALLKFAALFVLVLISSASFAFGQQGTPHRRISETVNSSRLVTLHGNTHPLARPEFDKGTAPDELPMSRMMMLLSRAPEQQAAFDRFVEEQQTPASPNFRHWLTPAEIGSMFGADDADVQTIVNWLQQQGFSVERLTEGKSVILFSGSAGQVQEAFHTAIHKYVVNGEEHWGNAQDPMIPAALAPVVQGLVSLNNFPRKPLSHTFGVYSRDRSGAVTPQYTVPGSSGNYYAVGPADFATIYNTKSLIQGGTSGSGQTIAIVGRTNVTLKDVTDFRNLFGLGAGNTSVVVDGTDPGVLPEDESEALLDLEWANAVAPGASVVLVTAQDTESTSGLDLAAVHAIENNMAGVMSESYGMCEANLGTAGNLFYQMLWQQAAAQGITVVVSSGDSGSAGCDNPNVRYTAKSGLGVNGLASTAYNVAVGGTDFDDAGTQNTYWNTSNDPTTLGSAKSYIPEMTWNETCAGSATAGNLNVCPTMPSSGTLPDGLSLWAGSGGASNCTVSTTSGSTITCQGGRTKPAWQTGPGVPNDGLRDLPDVSLFSAVSSNSKSFYVVCQADQLPSGYSSCQPSPNATYFLGVGGTSAAAPSFAGIVALAQQKSGTRLGNVNYLLYSIAANSGASCTSSASSNSSCVFHDIIKGNVSVPCVSGSPNCSQSSGTSTGVIVTSNQQPAFAAASGYDPATGLGSVDATNLATSIVSALTKFTPTSTALLLNGGNTPITAKHGDPINVAVSVNPNDSTGQVSLVGNTGGLDSYSLTSGLATWSSKLFPGGNYSVKAHYAGDGTHGASDSSPVAVSISPEASQTFVNLVTFDTSGRFQTFTGNSAPYGSNYLLRVDVADASATISPTSGVSSRCSSGEESCPTGGLTLTANGNPLNGGVFPLNSAGYAEDQAIQLVSGSYTVGASYSGDASYSPSTASAQLNISKAPTTIAPILLGGPPYEYGSPSYMTVTLGTTSWGAAPSTTFTFDDNGSAAGNSVHTIYQYGIAGGSTGYAQLRFNGYFAPPSVGTHSLTANYGGDSNYSGSDSAAVSITVDKSTTYFNNYGFVPNTATPSVPVNLSADIFCSSQLDQPTGTVTFYDNGTPISGTVTYTGHAGSWSNPGTGNYIAVLSAKLSTTFTQPGQHAISASYSGDDKYKPVTQSFGNLTVTAKFATSIPQIYSSMSPALKGYPTTLSATVGIPQTVNLPTATGTIVFSENGQPLSGTITYETTYSGYGSYTLSAKMPYSFSTSGTHNISATYSGDSSYAGSSSTTPLALTVADKLPSSIDYLNPPTALATVQTSLSANVTSNVIYSGPVMTGTVTFVEGDTVLPGNVQVQNISGYIIANMNYTFTTPGVHNITVRYSGDNSYAATQSKVFLVQVQGPIGLYLLTPQSQMTTAGGTGSTVLDISNNTGSSMTVSLTCTPDSSKASCSLDSTSMTISPSNTKAAVITYRVPSLYASKLPANTRPFTMPVIFAGMLAGVCLTNRRKRLLAAAVLMVALLFTLASCGGGGGTSGGNPGGGGAATPNPSTYRFTLTATSGTQTDSRVLTVTLQ